MLLTYSITKAERALRDVAQFLADNILTAVMTRIVVDKSTDDAKPLHYANELLVHVRLSFQKLLQTRLIYGEIIRNKCLGNE